MNSVLNLPLVIALQAKLADGAGAYHPHIASTSLKVLAALGLVLGILLIGCFVAKRLSEREGRSERKLLVKVLGSTAIGIKKSITLVEIPNAVLVLGVSHDTMCLLSTIEDDKALDMIRKASGAKTATPFAEQLLEFSWKFRKAKNGK